MVVRGADALRPDSTSNYSLDTCPERSESPRDTIWPASGDSAHRPGLHPVVRIAMLSYRSKPHCGGQGVYVRHLSRGLVELGHDVEVFSGQPYPALLDPRVRLTEVPSLDLYREPDPFRVPRPSEIRDGIDVLELLTTWTAGFPEPRTFTLRAARLLAERRDDFDVVHDNQSLGTGLLKIAATGLPVVAPVHHPLTRDRILDVAAARWWRQLLVRRWYGFADMQQKVAREIRKVCQIAAPARLCSAYMVVAIRTRGSSGVMGRRPPRRPRACAAMSPARVRSWTSRRSNCASAEKRWKTSSPEAVVVSRAPSDKERNRICRLSSSSIRVTRCVMERPRRSKRQTTKVSPETKRWTQASSPGRAVRAPEAMSRKIWSSRQPARRKASSCKLTSWSGVLTRV